MTSSTYILVVHHDADLYGADQSLLRSLRALRNSGLTPIVAVPHQGPLVDLMQKEGVEVHIGPVGKLTRQLMKPLALPLVARDMWASVRFMTRIVAGRPVVLVYSNSVAALGGALWALLHRVARLWHVREIVVAPKIAARGFPAMLVMLGGWCVCNSNATRRWIVDQRPSLASHSSVIWNGVEELAAPAPAEVAGFRRSHGIEPGEVLVTLVGRVNRWKGQGVLIEAAALLRSRGLTGIRFLVVGDVADGQHHFRETMLANIAAAHLDGIMIWHPFTPRVDIVWAASDIAVVPSIEPEPFGRVAIEAMAHGLPVVAAAHGGLAEIVVPGKTGMLVAPGNAAELADSIAALAGNADLRRTYGDAGRVRQHQYFSQAEHDRKLLSLIHAVARGQATVEALANP